MAQTTLTATFPKLSSFAGAVKAKIADWKTDLNTMFTELYADREVVSVSVPLHASKTVYNLFVARKSYTVESIDYVPDIAQGGALTATVVKATGTATPASGTTPMHTANAIDLNATAHTCQPITLTATAADLGLVAGQRIGLVLSGAMTVGSGVVTIKLKRA
jgi:hypothetical protein